MLFQIKILHRRPPSARPAPLSWSSAAWSVRPAVRRLWAPSGRVVSWICRNRTLRCWNYSCACTATSKSGAGTGHLLSNWTLLRGARHAARKMPCSGPMYHL